MPECDWIDDEMARRDRGQIRPLSQDQHAAINGRHYPGTRQLCHACGQPTGWAGAEDELTNDDCEPLCIDCFHEWEAGEARHGPL